MIRGRTFYVDAESIKLLQEITGLEIKSSKKLNTAIKLVCGKIKVK